MLPEVLHQGRTGAARCDEYRVIMQCLPILSLPRARLSIDTSTQGPPQPASLPGQVALPLPLTRTTNLSQTVKSRESTQPSHGKNVPHRGESLMSRCQQLLSPKAAFTVYQKQYRWTSFTKKIKSQQQSSSRTWPAPSQVIPFLHGKK